MKAGIRAVISFVRSSISGFNVFLISIRKVERTLVISGEGEVWESSMRGWGGMKVG
jgi:hypothetical protein